jgi:hypothetical protein
MLALVVTTGLEAVAADGHGAPAAGSGPRGVKEPERAVGIGALAHAGAVLVEQPKEAANGEPRHPPVAVDLELLPSTGLRGPKAEAAALENAVEPGEGGGPGTLEGGPDGVAGLNERPARRRGARTGEVVLAQPLLMAGAVREHVARALRVGPGGVHEVKRERLTGERALVFHIQSLAVLPP